MKTEQAKAAIKTALAITGVILGICGVVGGFTYLIVSDHDHDEQAICAPDKLDLASLITGIRMVCVLGQTEPFICQKRSGSDQGY